MTRHFVLLSALLFSYSALGATLQVCSSCPYTTIENALLDAQSGDTIKVKDSVHTEAGIIIKKDVIIEGSSGTVIQAAASAAEATDRVFFVQSGTVTLRNLIVRHGNQNTGAGIYISPGAGATISNCSFKNNEADDYGAVDNRGFTQINNSRIQNNYARSVTGALGNQPSGTLSMYNTLVSGNRSQWFNGGVTNFGTMTLENCTLTNNTDSLNDTGALSTSNGSLTLINCTVSFNPGWAVRLQSGTMSMNHVTMSGNTLGIDVKSALVVHNSIVAGNGTDMVVNGGSVFTDGKPNLCGDGTCPDFSIPNGNPNLGPLTDNGGVTPTQVPEPGSDALDAYTGGGCLPMDQRGMARPQGDGCDLGAVELYVEPEPEPNPAPKLSNYVAFAYRKLTSVDAYLMGDLGVRDRSNGSRRSMNLNWGTFVDGNVAGDKLKLDCGVTVNGMAVYNDLRGHGYTINGEEFQSSAMPLGDITPSLPSFRANGKKVTVRHNKSRTLEPGTYGHVVLKHGTRRNPAVLRLTGGVYNFKSLSLGNNAVVEALGPVQIAVRGKIKTTWKGFIGPADGSDLSAGDVMIFSRGRGAAIIVGNRTAVQAHVTAPYGKILVTDKAEVRGLLVADQIYLGRRVYAVAEY
ncbi:MAG: right-handed parallel beta-helix repeat-containing protein [Acidobacteriota bacterium]|nr:right-handed parallel beta-helix repeat-containing protein [Acidobacteriota bacterium]